MNRVLRNHEKTSDRHLRKLLEERYVDCPMKDNTIPLFVTQPKCRPACLRYLIHIYHQQKKVDETTWKQIVSKALLAFSMKPHPHQRDVDIASIIGFLRKNNADPHYKNSRGKDAFDYAYEKGAVLELDILETFLFDFLKVFLHFIFSFLSFFTLKIVFFPIKRKNKIDF